MAIYEESDGSAAEMLQLAYSYLGEPHGRSPSFLVNHARKQKHRLGGTLLTLFEVSGEKLSLGATLEIDRQRARRATYQVIENAISEVTTHRTLKGPAIARRYPPGVMRFVGDLDIAVPDFDGFWATAVELERQFPDATLCITLHEGFQVPTASFAWPAEDPFLDFDFHVDIMVTPFVGDGMTVPVRSLPTDLPDELISPILLAEEMFQRPPTLADALDLSLLLPHADPTLLFVAVEKLRLAPEMRRLLSDAGRVVPIARELAGDEKLGQMVVAEEAERSAPKNLGSHDPSWHLRRLSTSVRGPFTELDQIGNARVLQTPLGRFVAVRTNLIPAAEWREAERRWAEGSEVRLKGETHYGRD